MSVGVLKDRRHVGIVASVVGGKVEDGVELRLGEDGLHAVLGEVTAQRIEEVLRQLVARAFRAARIALLKGSADDFAGVCHALPSA